MHWKKREIGKAEIFDGCAGEGVGGTRCGCAGAGSGVDFFFLFFFLGGAEKVPVKMVLGSLKIMEITVWRAGGHLHTWKSGMRDVGARKNMKKCFSARCARRVFFFFVW